MENRETAPDFYQGVSGGQKRGPQDRVAVAGLKGTYVIGEREEEPSNTDHPTRWVGSEDQPETGERKQRNCPDKCGLPRVIQTRKPE